MSSFPTYTTTITDVFPSLLTTSYASFLTVFSYGSPVTATNTFWAVVVYPPGTSTAASSTTLSPNLTPTTTNSTPSKTSETPPSSNAQNTTIAQGNNKNSISQGDAAGIGIGCAIAGALLALLVVWFIMGRSRRHRHREGDVSEVQYSRGADAEKNIRPLIIAPFELS